MAPGRLDEWLPYARSDANVYVWVQRTEAGSNQF